MKRFSYSDGEAERNFHQNPGARWYMAGSDRSDPDGTLASQRIGRDLFTPFVDPGFQFDGDDRVYAIGSCFARGLEGALLHMGASVVSVATEFNSFRVRAGAGSALGFTNKYNTYSILNELRWALVGEDYPTGSVVEIEPGVCIDPHANPTLEFADLETTLQRRMTMIDVARRIAGCRVVVITLGLVELWRDDREGVVLNMSPTVRMRQLFPGRYSFHVSTFRENLENLEEIWRLLSEHGHPDVQIVVTVSPVPLSATFTERDVVVANTHSKAVLRAIAEEWSSSHSNVHYFPSYEIVMNSDVSAAWEDDRRHVQPRMVRHIMSLFLSHYFTPRGR